MSDMKCPFCQQELDCMGKYTDGSSKWLCNKCDLFGDKKLFDEIIAQADKAELLQKAVDLALDGLEYADKALTGGTVGWETQAQKVIKEIRHLIKGE